jgi:integrase
MQIAPQVMVRPGELRQATWDEFDLEAKVWRITAERMKMRRVHAVPLSDQVVASLRELQQFSGTEGYVFPAFHTSRRPMSENTMNVAFRRMGYSRDEVTAHGLRTTASTLLNESGKWHPDAIERALAHGDSDAVRGIYNRGQYWEERVRMMQWWSDYLDRLREGGEVVPFQQRPPAA